MEVWAEQFSDSFYSGMANLLEIFGFLISLLGFSFTLVWSYRSKRAADQARDAAEAMRLRLANIDILSELEAAARVLNESITLLRSGSIVLAVDRLTTLKNLLFSVKRGYPDSAHGELSKIQGVIQQISMSMTLIERDVTSLEDRPTLSHIVSLLTDETGRLIELKAGKVREVIKENG